MEELENIREEADEIETGAAEVRGRQPGWWSALVAAVGP